MNTNNFIISEKQMELDLKLAPYDLWATKVHVLMLNKQKIVSDKVAKKILASLTEISKEAEDEQFSIDPEKGLHLTVEKKVVEKIGPDGYYMHTARSRNDQVMTAELLYLRDEVLEVVSNLLRLVKLLMDLAKKHIDTVMTGYTHMQPAKPTTLGQWFLSYADMFSKCLDSLVYVFEKYDACPLGAVESYGTSWPIDRKYTAELLGFTRVWEVPQEAISSRGFPQLAILGVFKDIGIVISKIASDLLLFTTFEFRYLELGESSAKHLHPITGSSIMPQKKNPDVLEILRSTSPQLTGLESIVSNLLSNLPLGYNRDTREVKEYMEQGLLKIQTSLFALTSVLLNIKVNKEKMENSVLNNYSFATDLTDFLAQKTKLPYRLIYKVVGSVVKKKILLNQPFTTLTVEELNKEAKKYSLNLAITRANLAHIFDLKKLIEKRKHIGGAAFDVMKSMLGKRNKLQLEYQLWHKRKKGKIEEAKKLTGDEIWKKFNY